MENIKSTENFLQKTCRDFQEKIDNGSEEWNKIREKVMNGKQKGISRLLTLLFYAKKDDTFDITLNALEQVKENTSIKDLLEGRNFKSAVASDGLFGHSTSEDTKRGQINKYFNLIGIAEEWFNQASKNFSDKDTLENRLKKFKEVDNLSDFIKNNRKKDVEFTEEEWINVVKEMKKYAFEKIENGQKALSGGEVSQDKNKLETKEEDMKEKIKKLLEDGNVKQIVFTGAPGTGKTYLAKQIAEEIVSKQIPQEPNKDEEKKKYIQFVQFHPSYDYTDFVEGLRPIEDENNNIAFGKVNGIFKQFCQEVVKASQKEDKYFFIIDEINRADLSKVFGELMYCLEADKRGEKNRIATQYQNMQTYQRIRNSKGFYEIQKLEDDKDVFKEGFYIPENVYIIGTMNDIDRSVESMDFALRRRFIWEDFAVTESLLREAFESGNFGGVLKNEAEDLAKRIMELNEKGIKKEGKKFSLNEDYYISQGQFANLPKKMQNIKVSEPKNNEPDGDDLQKILEFTWESRIKPLLKEYVRGEEVSEIDVFIEKCRENIFVDKSKGEGKPQADEPKTPSSPN